MYGTEKGHRSSSSGNVRLHLPAVSYHISIKIYHNCNKNLRKILFMPLGNATHELYAKITSWALCHWLYFYDFLCATILTFSVSLPFATAGLADEANGNGTQEIKNCIQWHRAYDVISIDIRNFHWHRAHELHFWHFTVSVINVNHPPDEI